ncbi:hypothetical protein BDZ91DRAFT_236168 [Kalaharituber pfeilii]|nr:hypothetical protein BDZ91DRAFT_236168 [Kalaharituber pfeilii]
MMQELVGIMEEYIRFVNSFEVACHSFEDCSSDSAATTTTKKRKGTKKNKNKKKLKLKGIPPPDKVVRREFMMLRKTLEGYRDSLVDIKGDLEYTITMIFNTTQANESSASLEQNRMTYYQAEEMKTQTVVTLQQAESMRWLTYLAVLFLPATFVSTLFGMNVQEMSSFPSIWIFTVICVPITIVFISVAYWFDSYRHVRSKEGAPHGSTQENASAGSDAGKNEIMGSETVAASNTSMSSKVGQMPEIAAVQSVGSQSLPYSANRHSAPSLSLIIPNASKDTANTETIPMVRRTTANPLSGSTSKTTPTIVEGSASPKSTSPSNAPQQGDALHSNYQSLKRPKLRSSGSNRYSSTYSVGSETLVPATPQPTGPSFLGGAINYSYPHAYPPPSPLTSATVARTPHIDTPGIGSIAGDRRSIAASIPNDSGSYFPRHSLYVPSSPFPGGTSGGTSGGFLSPSQSHTPAVSRRNSAMGGQAETEFDKMVSQVEALRSMSFRELYQQGTAYERRPSVALRRGSTAPRL